MARKEFVSTRLRDLMPDYYEEVYEMDIILSIQQYLVDELTTRINQAEGNLFVMLADSDGLEVWEEALGILPVSEIEERRLNIISALLPPKPITIKYLNELIGFLNIDAQVRVSGFEVKIKTTTTNSAALGRLNYLLNRYLPANLAFQAINLRDTYTQSTPSLVAGQHMDVTIAARERR